MFQPDRISGLAPGQNYLNQDFVELCPLALSGRITRADSGEGMDLIPVQAGSNVVVTTNGGYFSLEVPYDWSGDVHLSEDSPIYPGDFQPLNYSFEALTQNQDGLNFEYDRSVEWSTYIGGAGTNDVAGAAADAWGNIYVVGTTDADGWISGGYQTERAGGRDAFVAKLDPQGLPVWSTYLGGTNHEVGVAFAVAPDGCVVVAGNTYSSNWVSGGVIEEKTGSGSTDNGFIVKLSASGEHEWSTYLGTTEVNGLAVSEAGTIWATGWAGTSPTNEGTFTGWWKGRVAGGHPNTSGSRPGNTLWMELSGDGQHMFFSTDLGYQGIDMASGGGGQYVVSDSSAGPVVRKCQNGLGYLQLDWPTNGLNRYWWQGGGGWRVAGGTNWLSTGEGLVMPAGSYTIEFKESTRMRPAPMDVTVARGQLHQMEVAYGDKPFANFQSGWNEGLVLATGSTGGEAHHNTGYDAYGGDLGPVLTYLSILGDGERGIVNLHLVGDNFLKFDGTGTQNGVSLSPMIACIDNPFFPSNEVPDRYVSSWYTNQNYWKPCSLQDGWQIEGGEAVIGNLEPEEVDSVAQWRVVADNSTNLLITGWVTNHHELASCVGDVQIECKTVGGTTNVGWLAPMDGLTYTKITNFPVNYEWETIFEDIDGDAKKVDTWTNGHVVVMLDRDTGASFAVMDGETGHVLFLWQNGMIDQPTATMHDMATSLQAGTNTLLLSGTTVDTGWLGGPTNWGGAFLGRVDEEGNWVSGSVVHPQANGQHVVEATPGHFVVVGSTAYSNGAWNVSGAAYPGGSSAIFVTQVELWTPPPPERPLLGEGEAGNAEVVQDDPRDPCDKCTPGEAGDPVITATGKFYLRETDLRSMNTDGIEYRRVYSTTFPYNGPYGYGWTTEYNEQLYGRDDGALVYRRGDWTRDVFTNDFDGVYHGPPGVLETIMSDGEGCYVLVDADNVRHIFNAEGLLTRLEHTGGQQLLFAYDLAGTSTVTGLSPESWLDEPVVVAQRVRLVRIDEAYLGQTNGCSVRLEYNVNGRVSRAILHAGAGAQDQSIEYGYSADGAGNLISVLDAPGRLVEYVYDDQHRLLTKTWTDSETCELQNAYDDANRVVTQQVGQTTLELEYGGTNNWSQTTTTIRDQETAETLRVVTERFQYTDSGRTARYTLQMGEALDPEGGEDDDLISEYEYDPVTDQLIAVKEAGGAPMHRVYDEKGHVTQEIVTNELTGEVITVIVQGNESGLLTNRFMTSSLHPGIRFEHVTARYDDRGRPVEQCRIGTNGTILMTTSIFEDLESGGERRTITDALGNRTVCEYTPAGKLFWEQPEGQPDRRLTLYYDSSSLLTGSRGPMGAEYQYEYDDAQRLIRLVDPLGHETLYTYEDNLLRRSEYGRTANSAGRVLFWGYGTDGRVVRIEQEGGGSNHLQEAYAYDSAGQVIRSTDAMGQVEHSTYDAAGRLVCFQDRRGGLTRYSYDKSGSITSLIGPDDIETAWDYDPLGFPICMRKAVGTELEQATTYVYGLPGKRTQIIWPDESRAYFEYDEFGRLISVTGAHVTAQFMAYDALDRVLTMGDGCGLVYSNLYDRYGNQVRRTYPDGTYDAWAFDANGNPVSKTDANGNIVNSEYDALDRIVAVSVPNQSNLWAQQVAYDAWGSITQQWNQWTDPMVMQYDDFGQMSSMELPGRSPVVYEHDELGRVTTVAWPDGTCLRNIYAGPDLVQVNRRTGEIETFALDVAGQTTQTVVNGQWMTTYRYDALRRLVEVSNNMGQVAATEYDRMGRKVATRVNGEPMAFYAYDLLGHVTNVSGPGVLSASFGYDAAGRMTNLIDSLGNPTVWERDVCGRLMAKHLADGQTEDFEYDAVGNLVGAHYPGDTWRSNAYDAARGLIASWYSDGTRVDYERDELGRMTACMAEGDTNAWAYNVAGLMVTSRQERAGAVVAYEYDEQGRRTKMSLNGQLFAVYEYEQGQLVAVSNAIGAFRYSWCTNRDAVASLIYPSGAYSTNRYDGLDRLTYRGHYDSTGVLIMEWNSAYDHMDRITNVVLAGGTEVNYTYDSRSQLTAAQRMEPGGELDPAWQYAYDYDGMGNFTQTVHNGTIKSYQVDEGNRYVEIDDGGTWVEPTYTPRGQMTDDGMRSYTWQADGRMAGVTGGFGSLECNYNPLGLLNEMVARDAGEEGSVVRRWIYDGMLPVAIADQNNEIEWVFERGLDISGSWDGGGGTGGLLALRDPEMSESGAYYLEDFQDNVTALLSPDDSLCAQYDYAPFGGVLAASGSLAGQPMQWRGKPRILETPLADYGYRYQHAELGRWLRPDPLRENGGLNLYAFTDNNPVTSHDAYGLETWIANRALDVRILRYLHPLAGHIYLEFDTEGMGPDQREEWITLVNKYRGDIEKEMRYRHRNRELPNKVRRDGMKPLSEEEEKGLQYYIDQAFKHGRLTASFHPDSVVSGDTSGNLVSVVITKTSIVDFNAPGDMLGKGDYKRFRLGSAASLQEIDKEFWKNNKWRLRHPPNGTGREVWRTRLQHKLQRAREQAPYSFEKQKTMFINMMESAKLNNHSPESGEAPYSFFFNNCGGFVEYIASMSGMTTVLYNGYLYQNFMIGFGGR
ncbi:MAG: DUF6531 domain-containing protein [Kiritimatiellae bacterium]|nr:DUF6531 domain-containing protein [Kiritimatiellia bacterium]